MNCQHFIVFSENAGDIDPKFKPKRLVIFDDIVPISAKQRKDTDLVKGNLRGLLDYYADQEWLKEGKESIAMEKTQINLTEHHPHRVV